MPEANDNKQTKPYSDPVTSAPELIEETQQDDKVQAPIRSVRSFFGSVATNKSRAGMIVAILALVVVAGFFLLSNSPNKKRPAGKTPADQKRATGPVNQLPNGPVSGPQDGLNPTDQDVTADTVQRTAANAPRPQNVNDQNGQIGGEGQPGTASSYQQSNRNLSQVQPFQPPAVPSAGSTQWVPQPYSGSSAQPQTMNQAAAQQISNSRRLALSKASMTYVAQQSNVAKGSNTGNAVSNQSASSEGNKNLGYRPGYHLSTHLETVASTALSAPVIVVVDYDYQRNGITVIPAGTRIIGRMGASTATGIVNLHFEEVRLPNGSTSEINAIGLDHRLMPIKGYVTGRHVIQQFLLAALAGMGSTAAVYAGNNVNGTLTEADLMRMQAANAANNSISNYASGLQQSVSQSLVVTVPANRQVEVMFTSENKSSASKSIAVSER